MKIKSLLLALSTVFSNAQDTRLELYPNVHLVGTKDQTLYLHPKDTKEWFMQHKPAQAMIGQINACKIKGVSFTISVPHVVNTPGWSHPIPKEKSIGEWKDAADGREISFAKLLDTQPLGFPKDLPEAVEPKNESGAFIFGTLFDPGSHSVITVNIPGVLEILDQKDSLEQLATFFRNVNPKGAITKRLNVKAKEKPILAMTVDPKFSNLVQGLSGAFVWQDKRPVGVFIAAAFYENAPPILLTEPILEITLKIPPPK